MADFKISELTELAAIDVAGVDILPIVDISADITKKVTITSLTAVIAPNASTWDSTASTVSANSATWDKASTIITTGSATDFLAKDGTYYTISTGISIGDSIGSAENNQLLITDGSGNLSEIPNIIESSGGGTLFLADDGTYKSVGGGDALTSNPLSQFASTTSAQLLGVMSDETGTGALVFATSPTLVTPNLGTPSVLVGTNITGTASGLTVGATTGVEAGADVTDTANVTAAGALMDSEVVNLAQVKAFDSADYATAAQGTTADNALPTTGGAMTGAITTTSTFDGRDVATDGAKLDGIEAGADVTDATNIAAAGGVIPTGTPDGTKFLRDDEVWTTIPGGGDALTSNPLSQFAETTSLQLLGVMSDETGTGALVFSTSPTLVTPNLGTPSALVGTNITGTAAGLTVGATTGVEAGADVTDTANVTAAGALMDSEVVNLAQVKAFDSADYATASQGATADNALPTTGGAMTGAITTTSTFDGRDVAADGTKLDGIEAGADVTDTTNVTAAGALMDSEVVNLAQVKAFDSTDYAAALGADDNYVTDAEKIVIGNTSGTNTGDQDISGKQDILSEGAFVDGDKTKLDGIETGADVTDAANILSSGGVIPTGTPDGTKFLRDDQVWTAIAAGGVSIGDTIGGAANNQILTTDGSGNLSEIPNIINTGGAGSLFLADDGVYKATGGGISIGDAIGGAAINNTLLYVDNSGNLQNNSRLVFTTSSLNFTGGTSTSNSSSSFGNFAGFGNASGNNTSIGNIANYYSIGAGKTAVGSNAGILSNGTAQVFIGENAGESCVGNRAIGIGYRANRSNLNGGIAIGEYALNSSSGTNNTAIGVNAGNVQNGSNNTYLGVNSGRNNSGSEVLALGNNAGTNNTQSNRLIIGQTNLPQFAGAAAAAAALPVAGTNGVYLYWDTTDNTIKARP